MASSIRRFNLDFMEEHKTDFAKLWFKLDNYERQTILDSTSFQIAESLGRVNGKINFINEEDAVGDIIDRKQYNQGISVAKTLIQDEINNHIN